MAVEAAGHVEVFQCTQGGRGGSHCVTPRPGYLHGPLQMLSPENGLCNYLALEKIFGMLILRIREL